MGVLGIVLFPIGFFFVLAGVIIAVDAPFMKEILDEVEFLNRNRRIIGAAIALIGFIFVFLSYVT
jgi:hypothetical protein